MAEIYFTGSNHSTMSFDGEPNIFKSVYIQVGLALLYLAIFGLSFFGNMAVTLVAWCYRKTKSVSNFWLANLAVANLALSLYCMIPNLTSHLLDRWIFGELMCRMYHLITSLWQGASILIHVSISLERYLFFLHPTRHTQMFTKQKLLLMTLGVWLTSTIISLPSFVSFGLVSIQPNENGDARDICVPIESMFTSATADSIYFLLIYFVPVVIVLATYLRVGLFLRESGKPGMELDEQNPRAQNELSLASKLRPSKKDGKVVLFRVEFAPGRLEFVSDSTTSSQAGRAKGSRRLDSQDRYGLHFVPTIELTPTLDDDRPSFSTDRDVGRSDCEVGPVVSLQEMLSEENLEVTRKYNDECCGESDPGSHSPTAGTTLSSSPQERTRAARALEAEKTLSRVERQQLSRKQDHKSLWMLTLIFLTFAVLNFPHHACKIWLGTASLNGTRDDAKLLIAQFTVALMHANCAVNPIIYYAFMSKHFRASLNDLFSRFKV